MTLEDFWNISIQSKWVPVIIEGKPIKDKALRDELVLRLDQSISKYNYSSASIDFSSAIASLINVSDCLSRIQVDQTCKELKENYKIELDNTQLFNANLKACHKDIKKWEAWWGKNPYYGEASIFTTDISNERSFFNLKTGKIKPTVKYVGSWLSSIKEFKEEIDWFAKEFPQVDLIVTFTDENDELTDYKFLASLHIHDGTYELVDTKNYKEVANLPIYSGKNWKRIWKNFLFKFIKLAHNIQKVFNENAYDYWVSYKLLNKFYNFHSLLSTKDMISKMTYWNDQCILKKGSFSKYLFEEN